MYDNFTERAKTALSIAEDEAKRLGQEFIGPEHLLLALWHQTDGAVGRALAKSGVSLEQARAAVAEFQQPWQAEPVGSFPISSTLSRVLDEATEAAKEEKRAQVSANDLILALLDDAAVVTLLDHMGADAEQIRAGVSGKSSPVVSTTVSEASPPADSGTVLERLQAAVKRAGLRIGRPALEVINDIGDAEPYVWAAEVRTATGASPSEADLAKLRKLAQPIFSAQPKYADVQPVDAPVAAEKPERAEPAAAPVVYQEPGLSCSDFSDVEAPRRDLGRLRIGLMDDNSAELLWNPCVDSGMPVVLYLIIGGDQKIDRPQMENRLTATDKTSIRLPNAPRYISVFAYAGMTEEEAKKGPGRLVAIDEVVPDVQLDSHAEAAESLVIRWINPRDISGNIVYRSMPDQPLSDHPTDQDKVDLSRLGRGQRDGREILSLTDTGLTPGATYQYRIHAIVTLPDGTKRQSHGLLLEVTTVEQLLPVTLFRVSPESQQGEAQVVSLMWTQPKSGTLRIFHSFKDPQSQDLEPGKSFSVANLEQVGTEIIADPDMRFQDDRKISHLELPQPDFKKLSNDRVTHCLTFVTVGKTEFVVGATAAVPVIAPVGAASLQDRVDWQLLKLRWPAGADNIRFIAVRPGPQGYQVVESGDVSRDEYAHVGGVRLMKLGGYPALIRVFGVCGREGKLFPGGAAVVQYPGHSLIRYDVHSTWSLQGLSRSYQHNLTLEREGAWLGKQTFLLAGGDPCPIAPEDITADSGIIQIGTVEIEPGTLAEDVPSPVRMVPRDGAAENPPMLRLLAPPNAPEQIPMLSWRTWPTAPDTKRKKTSSVVTCPECFAPLPVDKRVFVCMGSCSETSDDVRMKALGLANQKIRRLIPITLPPAVKGQPAPTFPNSVVCNACGVESTQIVCAICHARLSPSWFNTDLLTVSVIGTKSAGKSVYIWSLLPYLHDCLIKDLGGIMQASANSASTVSKLQEINQLTQSWEYPPPTQIFSNNAELRLPMLFNLGAFLDPPADRLRALSIFDNAGEMLENENGAMLAAPMLANSDLLVFMLDMRQIDIVHETQVGNDKPSEIGPGEVLVNVLKAIQSKSKNPPKLAVVLNQFDLVQHAAKVSQKVANLLNRGDAVFQDPYALCDDDPDLYYPEDARLVDMECRQFLRHAGQGGLLKLIDGYPGSVQYFAVSSVGGDPRDRTVPADGISPFRVADPLRWAMYEKWVL